MIRDMAHCIWGGPVSTNLRIEFLLCVRDQGSKMVKDPSKAMSVARSSIQGPLCESRLTRECYSFAVGSSSFQSFQSFHAILNPLKFPATAGLCITFDREAHCIAVCNNKTDWNKWIAVCRSYCSMWLSVVWVVRTFTEELDLLPSSGCNSRIWQSAKCKATSIIPNSAIHHMRHAINSS